MRNNTTFKCVNCGEIYKKWAGKCTNCDSWGTINEEENFPSISSYAAHSPNTVKGKAFSPIPLDQEIISPERIITSMGEFNKIVGGGLTVGSIALIGGEPGIGKSTLLLQICSDIAQSKKCFYITGEESADQIIGRSKRIVTNNGNIGIVTSSSIADIIATLEKYKDTEFVVIDSIQTMFNERIMSSPGTISQVRESTFDLVSFAKKRNVTMVIVGHVTKDGQIAGPKLLEHMVDTVLYFESEKFEGYRILRTVKNRFGTVNEIGIFEMSEKGLREVDNPSLFIGNENEKASGTVIFSGMEGTRPMLLEVQALVSSTNMATPRRAVVGWDNNRLATVTAILNKRYGLFLGDKEIYLNIAGGIKIKETAADLAIAAALISAAIDIIIDPGTIIFGELTLSGFVRPVSHTESRIREAAKLGFKRVILPHQDGGEINFNSIDMEVIKIRNINDLRSVIQQ